jgi:hypothetical protein
MRFFIGCDVEGCPHGLRWDDPYGKVGRDMVGGGQLLILSELTFPIPDGWYIRHEPAGGSAGIGDVTILCDDHAPIDGDAEPGRYPFLLGRCGTCQSKPGVICDLCGNGLGKNADPEARRALAEGRRE